MLQHTSQPVEHLFDPIFISNQVNVNEAVPPLYAPVPIQSAAPLLDARVDFDDYSSAYSTPATHQEFGDDEPSFCGPGANMVMATERDGSIPNNRTVTEERQPTFPTPSELLSAEEAAAASSPEVYEQGHYSSGSDVGASEAKVPRKQRRQEPLAASPEPANDLDTTGITSHDKKRHYLECIEQYISFLHDRMRAMNKTPPPFVRVDSYSSLSNPSMRTLLVHMERELAKWSMETEAEEKRWVSLCQLLIPRLPHLHEPGIIATHLTHSLIPLFKDYAGDPSLREYLQLAIKNGILPLPRFISNLLDAARSPDLRSPSTLDTLVRIALDAHYSSGKPPIGSVVAVDDPTVTILRTVKDCMALLRIAYSLPLSPFHQLTTSVSELLVLLISPLNDFSEAPAADTSQHFTDANELLHNYQLLPNLRQLLESHLAYLSIILGDDVKAARATQISHTPQHSLARGSVFGPNSTTDIVSSGLLLNYLVTYRAEDFGAGDTERAVALLVASFRSSSWSPTAFYTQMFLAAFSCLTQATAYTGLWKAFIIGRFPILLNSLAEHVNSDTADKIDMKDAASLGLSVAFRRTDVVMQAEHVLEIPPESAPDDEPPRSFSKELLQAAVKFNLINSQTAIQLDSSISNETNPKWYNEALDGGMDIQTYLEAKLSHDNSIELHVWVERIWRDASIHGIFAKIVLKRFSALSAALDADAFGHWCKMLYSNDRLLDVVALHVKISDLLFYAIQFLDIYDCENVGDPQTAVTHFGDVVLFVQYTVVRYKLQTQVPLVKDGKSLSPEPYFAIAQDKMPPQEPMTVIPLWFKSLFDSNSEGIEDSVLRQAKPKSLISMSCTLLFRCLQVALQGKIDKEVLMNGVSYFTGPLLSWTLTGVIKMLVRDTHNRPPTSMFHLYFDIIQALILSPSCPKVVISLTAAHIISVCDLPEPKRPPPASFNVAAIRQAVSDAILSTNGDATFFKPRGGQSWNENVHQILQTTFNMARLQRSPFLDVKLCLYMVQPLKFLSILWGEVLAAMALGETEACRRVVTFVLTTPVEQMTLYPPLLPLFIHTTLPSLIHAANQKPPADRAAHVDMLTMIISSVLNAALNFEWAVRSVANDDRVLLGQSCASVARRLAADLRRNGKGSEVSAGILQRLASSQPFVANFPVFKSDISA